MALLICFDDVCSLKFSLNIPNFSWYKNDNYFLSPKNLESSSLGTLTFNIRSVTSGKVWHLYKDYKETIVLVPSILHRKSWVLPLLSLLSHNFWALSLDPSIKKSCWVFELCNPLILNSMQIFTKGVNSSLSSPSWFHPIFGSKDESNRSCANTPSIVKSRWIVHAYWKLLNLTCWLKNVTISWKNKLIFFLENYLRNYN